MEEKLLTRDQVPLEKTWDTTKIYENEEKFYEDFDKVLKNIEELKKYKGRLVESLENFKNSLKLRDETIHIASLLYTYSHLNTDVDTTNSHYQALNMKAHDLYTKVYEAMSYMSPELLSSDEKVIQEYLNDEQLKVYKFEFELLFRNRPHTLNAEQESLLAKASNVLSSSQQTFSFLNNADLKFGNVKNDEGKEIQLSHGRYYALMESKNREVRKMAFETLYESYKSHKNTFASTLSSTVKVHNFYADVYHFESARHRALFGNTIDEKVYDALLRVVNDNLNLLHEYYELRKKVLKLDDMKVYDIHAPILENVDLKFSYEEAKEIICEALKVYGQEYADVLKQAFEDRWIDQIENEGKRSGAYSSGTYGTAPYILLNWNGTLGDVYTLAHELGHSVHSYFTRKNQPFIYGDYSIFLAEIASTTNENLLTAYLLNKYEDKKIQAYIINEFLESFNGTIFRQTQFAEFEHKIHKDAQDNIALTADYLTNTYFEMNKKYLGSAFNFDENIGYEWARIPHFYYNYYVYQYATGFSAAIAFSKKILEKNPVDIEKYLGYLKAGSSNYPQEVLKNAGLDMTVDTPIKVAMEVYREYLDRLKKLLNLLNS